MGWAIGSNNISYWPSPHKVQTRVNKSDKKLTFATGFNLQITKDKKRGRNERKKKEKERSKYGIEKKRLHPLL